MVAGHSLYIYRTPHLDHGDRFTIARQTRDALLDSVALLPLALTDREIEKDSFFFVYQIRCSYRKRCYIYDIEEPNQIIL